MNRAQRIAEQRPTLGRRSDSAGRGNGLRVGGFAGRRIIPRRTQGAGFW